VRPIEKCDGLELLVQFEAKIPSDTMPSQGAVSLGFILKGEALAANRHG